MVLKLYGYPVSGATRRVAAVLHEKQVPFEFISIDILKGEHKQSAYLQNHPFGQVPYIDDNGFIMYESRSIARYICAKYPGQGSELVPSADDIQAYALYDQASSVEAFNFNAHAVPIYVEVVFKPRIGAEPIQSIIDEYLPKLNASLDAYEGILGRQRYLTGDKATLVDIFHLPSFSGLIGKGLINLKARPNLARWWNEVSSRPSWLAVKDKVVSVEEY